MSRAKVGKRGMVGVATKGVRGHVVLLRRIAWKPKHHDGIPRVIWSRCEWPRITTAKP